MGVPDSGHRLACCRPSGAACRLGRGLLGLGLSLPLLELRQLISRNHPVRIRDRLNRLSRQIMALCAGCRQCCQVSGAVGMPKQRIPHHHIGEFRIGRSEFLVNADSQRPVIRYHGVHGAPVPQQGSGGVRGRVRHGFRDCFYRQGGILMVPYQPITPIKGDDRFDRETIRIIRLS